MLESSLWREGSRCTTTTKVASTSSGRLSKNICRACTPLADVPMPTVGNRFSGASSLAPPSSSEGRTHDQHRSSVVRELSRRDGVHLLTSFARPSILILGEKGICALLII